jgi:hypothetical protein
MMPVNFKNRAVLRGLVGVVRPAARPAILGERLLFFRDFAFELSHAPFEFFNHTTKLLDGSVDVVAENF